MKNCPIAVFYCGANGSGKSTLRGLRQDSVSIVIDSDHIAKEISPENPRLADAEAGRKAIKLFQFALENGISFSMESTLSGHSILRRIEMAKQAGFWIEIHYVGLNSSELNVQRVAERVQNGGHWIDPDLIRQRFDKSRANLPSAISLANTCLIYDNSGDAPQLHLIIEENYFNVANILNYWTKKVYDELVQMDYHAI